MKKVYLIGALGGLLLASCANDDLVVKPDAPAAGDGATIAFETNVGNISRANLNDAGYTNFGVWAIKADQASDLNGVVLADDPANSVEMSASVVMPDYLVNYGSTPQYGSKWSYVLENFATNDPATTLTQYLKYWDGGVNYTYFFGYAPHNATRYGDDASDLHAYDVNLSIADGVAKLQFPTYEMSTDADYNFIYSNVAKEDNKVHVTAAAKNTTLAPKPVSLAFSRVLSQLQIAFYEDIPGYKVKMVDVFPVGGTEAKVAAIPADRNVTDGTQAVWTRGGIVNQAKPYVTYNTTTNDFDTPQLVYASAVRSESDINFALPTTNLDAKGHICDKNDITGSFVAKTNASFSPTVYNVVPKSAGVNITSDVAWGTTPTAVADNSGLQFVVNYDLESVDTKEVIHVKGARVYVTPTYTAWTPNTVYTYYFRISVNSSGTTTGTDPVDNPVEPEACLYPIIFDSVTIADLATANESTWIITDLVMTPTTLTLSVGDTYTLIVTDSALPTAPTVTWATSDDTVATVDDGLVTAVAAGSAIITATDGDGHVATCKVTVN